MPHILIADKIAPAGLKRLQAETNATFEIKQGLSPQELASTVGGFDGMFIRSGVKLTPEVFANSGKLSVVARAGVGVDNIDLDAATAAGVLVLNTPDANTISTAEHTFGLLLALHRRIPDAHHHVLSGEWKRSEYQGSQLAGRTLGVIGLGRIGRAVALRGLAFEMNVVAYDPFVTGDSALDGAVSVVKELGDLLACADCITLHASLTDKTRHMIGADELALMKTDARLVNCARGPLIDEAALANALNEGIIAGAAIDVYEKEPPIGSPLLTAKNIVLTPHLAASTEEAQERVSVEAVEALLAYLLRGEIRSAVNLAGMPPRLPPHVKAFMDLASRQGRILSAWCSEGIDRLCVTAYGDRLQEHAALFAWQVLVSVLEPHLNSRLNLVNVKDQAKARGITVEHIVRTAGASQPDSLTARIEADGETHEIEGTVLEDGLPRIAAIDGYRMDLVAERSVALIFNDDRPGVVGLVGKTVGDQGINIADMALSRRGEKALMVLKLDEPLPATVADSLRSMSPPIHSVQAVTLPACVQTEASK